MSASREKKKRQELREESMLEDNNGKKSRKKLSEKAKNRIYAAIAVVLLVVFALLIFVNSGFLETHLTAVTAGSYKVTPAQYNYFYMDTYYTYYSYYGDYVAYFDLESTTLSTIEEAYSLYDQAEEAGYILTQDEVLEIEETITALDESADYYGYKNANTYLEAYFGKGSDTESYEEYLTMRQIASDYANEIYDSFSYTDEEIEAYYEENVTDFDLVTYRYYFVDGSAEDDEDETDALNDAAAIAEAMATASAGSEDTFISMAYDNADEDSKETYEDEDATLREDISYSSLGSDYADWLFDTARREGETTYVESTSSTGYYVLYFVSRDTLDYNTVNVRHILIEVDDTTDEDEMAEALAEAEEILAEYEAGEQTAEAFAELAETYSSDTGSNTNGGLYEEVYQGEMVDSFNDWCFDESREPGDTGIVESDYGYHIMYFDSYGDIYRNITVESTMRSDDYSAWYEEISADFEPVTSSFGMRFISNS